MSKFFEFQDSINECWRIVNIDKIITVEKYVKYNNENFSNEEKRRSCGSISGKKEILKKE